MSRILNLLILPIIFFILASCGFKSVYSNKSTNNILCSIVIEPIDSIEGAEFYHNLQALFPLTNKPLYKLHVNFNTKVHYAIIQKNTDILMNRLTQIVTYKLLDIEAGVEITSGQFQNITTYSTSFSGYSSHTSNEMELTNLAKIAADRIRDRLILYFSQNFGKM